MGQCVGQAARNPEFDRLARHTPSLALAVSAPRGFARTIGRASSVRKTEMWPSGTSGCGKQVVTANEGGTHSLRAAGRVRIRPLKACRRRRRRRRAAVSYRDATWASVL